MFLITIGPRASINPPILSFPNHPPEKEKKKGKEKDESVRVYPILWKGNDIIPTQSNTLFFSMSNFSSVDKKLMVCIKFLWLETQFSYKLS